MKNGLFDYDDRFISSIFEYAKQLEKMTFRQVKEEFDKSYIKSYHNNYDSSEPAMVSEPSVKYGASFNYAAKGQLGNFIERFYFGYDPNGNQNADFSKVGMELKLTPIDKRKDGKYRAGERLSITNISYEEPVEEDFYRSHVWDKIKLILLIHYLRDKSIDRLDYTIEFVSLFKPTDYPDDLKIIIEDYNKIINKIKEGKAHELSEGDTLYLGACTKGTAAKDILRRQYYGTHELAKKRNFCFKQTYMDYVLQTYILKQNLPYEKIVSEKISISFEEYIINKINANIGMSDEELCKKYHCEYTGNKAQWSNLAYRMLGIKGNHAEEFAKANIVVKTIRLEENGKNRENMSFPPFRFNDLVNEEWENSTIYNYFETTKFLFVIYKNNGKNYILLGSQLWNMPYKDLNDTVCKEWRYIQSLIKNGIKFDIKKDVKGNIKVSNNLPGISDTEIIHIRPHAKKAAYKLANGFITGNIERDANELPDGQWMTTQSFWINNSYILKQLKYK